MRHVIPSREDGEGSGRGDRLLSVDVTNDLGLRVEQHRAKSDPNAFTAQYHVTQLVYFEEYQTAAQAIAREKQLKAYRRAKKIALIDRFNPTWQDLAPRPDPSPSLRSGSG